MAGGRKAKAKGSEIARLETEAKVVRSRGDEINSTMQRPNQKQREEAKGRFIKSSGRGIRDQSREQQKHDQGHADSCPPRLVGSRGGVSFFLVIICSVRWF